MIRMLLSANRALHDPPNIPKVSWVGHKTQGRGSFAVLRQITTQCSQLSSRAWGSRALYPPALRITPVHKFSVRYGSFARSNFGMANKSPLPETGTQNEVQSASSPSPLPFAIPGESKSSSGEEAP